MTLGTKDKSSGGGGGGGMSRAAKKRAKKKQKEMQKLLQQDRAEGTPPARAAHEDNRGDGVEKKKKKKKADKGKDKKKKRKERLQPGLATNGAADDYDNEDEMFTSNQADEGMDIADVSGGELDYLATRGVKVTSSSSSSEKPRTKEKKRKKKTKRDRDDNDGDDGNAKRRQMAAAPAVESSGDDADTNDDAAVDSDEDGDEVERSILEMLSTTLTPSEILFPREKDGVEANDEHENNGGPPPHQPDIGSSQPERAQTLGFDPSLILRDLTSQKRARVLLESILKPAGVTAEEFYNVYWEKKPLLISRPRVGFVDEDGGGGNDNDKRSADNKRSSDRERHESRLDGILSKSDIERMLDTSSLRYGRELNITRYADDGDGVKRRITLDLPPRSIRRELSGKKGGASGGGGDADQRQQQQEQEMEYPVADPDDVWSNFSSGCTVRLLCPHLHSDSVHALLSTLEFEWGCMVGANAYLTPGGGGDASSQCGAQGFAPHYDDIEAFVLQLEGQKRWRVYPPPNRAETLPRVSSRDYTEKDLENDEPVIDAVLGPGDVLYMPRGWIHQAHTPQRVSKGGGSSKGGGHHSLHLTASAMQNWAWADLLEMIIPEALEAAAASDTSTSLREGLPRDFLSYMGAMHDDGDEDDNDGMPEGLRQAAAESKKNDSDNDEEEEEEEIQERLRRRRRKALRRKFREDAKKRIMRVCKEAISMVDAGCDQIGKRFLSDRQPPALTLDEQHLTSEARAETGGKVWPNTMCRLARPGIARLVLEDGKAVLYHCADNSRVYHGSELSPMEFEIDDAPALEALLTTVEPHWICVKDLIHGDIEDKMDIAQALFDEGILAIYQANKPDKSVQTG